MKECNNKTTADFLYNLFLNKLHRFPCIGDREWVNAAGITVCQTYEINDLDRKLYVAPIIWLKAGSLIENREGLLMTLPIRSSTRSLGQITEVVIPFEFSRVFNTRVYESSDTMEVRSYGKFTVGKKSLTKVSFFEFIRDTGCTDIFMDEEEKPYVKIFDIKNKCLSQEEFARESIDFTYMIKKYKDKFR